MLTLPDLNKVKVFYAVYSQKNLVRAAASLNITRSAVSQSLKALEDELKTQLFIRDSKKIIPTEAAETLFKTVEPFFNELQSTVRQIETGQKNPVGILRIGAPQDFGSDHLTEAIAAFRRKNSQVSFEITLATPVTLLNMLADDKLDLAFVDNGDLHSKNFPVSKLTVMKEKFIPVCSKQYFDENLRSQQLRFDHLKNLHFVDYLPHAPVTKMWVRHHFGKTALNLNIVFSAESVRALIRAALGSVGIAVVPEHLVADHLRTGKLKVLSHNKDLINQITLSRRLGRKPSAKERDFVEFYKGYLLAKR